MKNLHVLLSRLALGVVGFFLAGEVTFSQLPSDAVNRLDEAMSIAKENRVDQLFGAPGWRDGIAEVIANAVGECRVTPAQLEAYYAALGASGTPPFPKTREVDPSDVGMVRAVQSAFMKRSELLVLMEKLARLRDPRVVPLIAPLLSETTGQIFTSDSGSSPPQETALSMLNDLKRFGVVSAETDEVMDVQKWRQWWNRNRNKFDAVPVALRAIDMGEQRRSSEEKVPGFQKDVRQASKTLDVAIAGGSAVSATPRQREPQVDSLSRPSPQARYSSSVRILIVGIIVIVGLCVVWFRKRRVSR